MILSVAAVLAAAALQTEPEAPADVVVAPDWIHNPILYQDHYPPMAAAMELTGRAWVTCRVWQDGPLLDCAATASPSGIGFEEAALEALAASSMRAQRRNGRISPGAQVRLPMNFVTSFDTVFPPYRGPQPDPAHIALAQVVIEANWRDEYMFHELGIPEGRQDELRPMVQEAIDRHEARLIEGHALAVARIQAVITSGVEVPQIEFEDDPLYIWSDYQRATRSFGQDLRRAYCAANDCEIVTLPPPVLSELPTPPTPRAGE